LALALGASLPIAGAAAPPGGKGNGAPSGAHFNLNIIGVPKGKTASMTGTSGHTIFVNLEGKSTIWLCESGVDAGCGSGGFIVIDRNGTDNDGATFGLPNPDPDNDGSTEYSVFARALGAPGGSSTTTTCVTDPGGELECSVISLVLTRDKGKSRFDNVSKYLLYVYADVDEDGDLERVPLFADGYEGFLWDYDNNGLRLAQLRFYECTTIVPEPDNPGGPQDDSDCF
jgi:hypothetical protein